MQATPPPRSDLLAEKVCQARDEAGLSNAEFARKAGLPRRTIVRITNGQNKARIQQETIEAIAGATGKPVGFFEIGRAAPLVVQAAESLVAALVHELREKIAADQAVSREDLGLLR